MRNSGKALVIEWLQLTEAMFLGLSTKRMNACIISGDFIHGAKGAHYVTMYVLSLIRFDFSKESDLVRCPQLQSIVVRTIRDISVILCIAFAVGRDQFCSLSKLSPSIDSINTIHTGILSMKISSGKRILSSEAIMMHWLTMIMLFLNIVKVALRITLRKFPIKMIVRMSTV